jgi:hypothetical protein
MLFEPDGQRRRLAAGGDGHHQVALAHDGRRDEVAVRRVVHHVHQQPQRFGLFPHLLVDAGSSVAPMTRNAPARSPTA